jgi:hypothetical protein
MENQWLIGGYAVLFLINFLLFGLQRTALLIDREFESSYVLAVLPWWLRFAKFFSLCKLIILGYFFFHQFWVIAISLLVCDFILSAVLPIPHKIYEKTLRKQVELRLNSTSPKSKSLSQTLDAINNTKYFK